jgi:glycosyltransferase involved in cell wall biosynthesis
VIIPTKNEGTVIESCLSSVFNQSVKPSEVIVVDGRSTDNTIEKVQHYPVRILIEDEPTSAPSNAINLGAQQADGEVLLLLAADMVLDRDCLKNALEYFRNPDVIAIVPDVEVSDHTRLEKIYGKWLQATKSPVRIPNTDFIRREVFNNIKFDRNLGYGEDDDFQIRLRRAYGNSNILWASDCKISKHLPHSIGELWQQHAWYGRTFSRYFSKNHGLRQILALGSLLAPTFLLVLTGVTLVFTTLIPLLLIGFITLMTKNLIACYRSKTFYLLEFLGLEFLRSIFFLSGIVQGLFVKRTGR